MIVKSTINISSELKEELSMYVEKQVIPSLSSGINAAIELYLKQLKKDEYALKMKEAKDDKAFIERTMICQAELDEKQGALNGQW